MAERLTGFSIKLASQNSVLVMLTRPVYTRFPRVQIWRRGVAFLIDFVGVWLLSSLLGGNMPGFQAARIVVFVLAWLGLRVLLVYKNQGQSLGRFALDMKVLDVQLGRVPDLQALFKREGVTGFCALLVAIGLSYIGAGNLGGVLLMVPLGIDCGIALSDTQVRQTVHDRIARTMMVSTRRGYSLDIKVKRLLAFVRTRVIK